MQKLILSFALQCFFLTVCLGQQIDAPKFGSGIKVMGKDSSYYLKLGFRFQTLYTHNWDITDGSLNNYEAGILIRRSRLKFDGWAHSTKLTYKLELALSNRDNSGGASSEFRNAANIILDASVKWNFYKNLSIQFGQRKLPGNRERIISSGNLQFVDRSRLNSRFTTDRDVGLQLFNHHKIGSNFIIKETLALSQGEGRNVTEGHFGGYNFSFKLEAFPFGEFSKKGAYVGSATVRESSPKLAVALSYDANQNAVRERGQKGSFITDSQGSYIGKNLNTLFLDAIFKYEGLSIMFEYAKRETADGINEVYETINGTDIEIGQYYTGSGVNFSVGYLMNSNWELAARYTKITPELGVSNDDTRYTLGLSKYIVGHKLKFQTDLTYLQLEGKDNGLMFRTQVDLHF